MIMNFILTFKLASVMWVQVPQWAADWSKCAVDVPGSSCHWYEAALIILLVRDLIGKTLLDSMLIDYRM